MSRHFIASLPEYETFFVSGGSDEMEAELARRIHKGYSIPNGYCYQTYMWAVGYWVSLIPPSQKIDFQI